MVADDFEKPAVVAWIFESAGKERLGKTLDRREGRLELMRDVGDEIVPHALEPAQLGHIVQYDNGARWLVARQGSLEGLHRRGRHRKIPLLDDAHRDVASGGLLRRAKPGESARADPNCGPLRSPDAPRPPPSRDSRSRKRRDCRRQAFPARRLPRRPPPCFAGSRSNDCARRSASGSCCPSKPPFRSAPSARSASSSRGRSAGKGRKSPSETRCRKILEPFDAGGEHPEIDQRTHAAQHKDEQRGGVNPSPQLRTRCVHLRERQRHADHDRWPPGLFTSRGAINKIAAQRCAVAHRTSFARGECLLDLRLARRFWVVSPSRSESARTWPKLSIKVTRAPLRAIHSVHARSSAASCTLGGRACATFRSEASLSSAERMESRRRTREE